MVQIMDSSSKKTAMAGVKVEVEADSLEDQLGPLHKRPKLSDSSLQMVPASLCNPLDEPSPLGLRLKKSPSFLDLIQMKLSQETTSARKDHKGTSSTTDKLKASNFPASLLKVGSWEYKSRYEGDLVAKCYFAKHKLVWEVLDGGLKNKMEIQWSDIVAIKANFCDDGPETLDVVLARQPLFFRETNPQPRKHTLWQATSDFTGGEASIHRRHFLHCQPGFMGKHFEKLIQCDPRLNFLSQQPEISLESPYFDRRASGFNDLNKPHKGLDLNAQEGPAVFTFSDTASPSGVLSSSLNDECKGFLGRSPENISNDSASPSSAMNAHVSEEIGITRTEEQKLLSHWDQVKVPGIKPSMSMSDLVNHIGNCISEQLTSGNHNILAGGNLISSDILEELTQYVLSDSQLTSASDEQSLLSRVNSLCCLLQKDSGTAQNLQANDHDMDHGGKVGETNSINVSTCQSKAEGESGKCKAAPSMSRKDSVGELLLNLPRIASLPQFLFNI